ncbi:hypothetical protein HDU91_007046, partial [Kappamyces sp. JEL0680]
MAILPKSSPALVTISSWGTAVQERLAPVLESVQSAAVTSFTTTKAVLDRYPPLK